MFTIFKDKKMEKEIEVLKRRIEAQNISIKNLEDEILKIRFEKNNKPKYKVGQIIDGKVKVVSCEIVVESSRTIDGVCYLNLGEPVRWEYKFADIKK